MFLPGMFQVPYRDRIERLGLESMEIRRILADLVLIYKMVHEIIDFDYNDHFTVSERISRGHSLKLNLQYCWVDCICRKYFFVNRIFRIWVGLDEITVELDSLSKFEHAFFDCNLSRFCRGRAQLTVI